MKQTLTFSKTLFRISLLMSLAAGLSLVASCKKAAPPAPAVGPDVWATVDGREIRREEVEKAYRGALEQVPPSDEDAMTAKLGVLDELISQDILLARAQALAVAPTDAEIDKAFADRKGALTEEAFQQQLRQRGFTADDLKRGVRRELTMQKVMEHEVQSKINITDPDITAFYNQNRAQFNVTEPQVHLAQIVVTPGRDAQITNRLQDDATSPVAAQEKIKMLMDRLKTGAEFAALAADYSEDPQSAAQSGDLGMVPVSALDQAPPQLKAAVGRMQPGTANVISIGPNYAIVMLVSREAPGQRDLSMPSVHDGIRDMLKARKERLLRAAYISAMRSDAKVVNYLARQVVTANGLPPAR
ncbi:MAG: SurA N-terminal domain-containing protein [Vicinamibacterales bacterium]